MSVSLVFWNTGEVIEVKDMAQAISKSPAHPIVWFNKNPNLKPKVVIPQTNIGLKKLREHVYAGFTSTSVDKLELDMVLEYLFEVFRTKSELLTEDWTSYGRVIGSANQNVNPFSLVDVTRVSKTPNDGNIGGQVTEKDDLWLCIMILAVYRLQRASDDNYRKHLVAIIKKEMLSVGAPYSVPIQTIATTYISWSTSNEYRKIVAIVDMFYFKFEKSKWALIRVGTIECRFRDCAALKAYTDISKLLGFKKQKDLLFWFFHRPLANEAEQMFSTDEEFSKADSYFPYHIDLGLSSRSAYSSKKNPGIHFFANVVGVMLSQQGCCNAKNILDSNVFNVFQNAKLVGYVFMRNAEIKKMDASEQLAATTSRGAATNTRSNPATSAVSEDDNSMIDTAQPTGTDPKEWFNYMESREWEPDSKMKEAFARVQSQITSARPGSVGEFIKSI